MASRFGGGIQGLARTSRNGARETLKYYSKSGPEERRIIAAAFYMGITGAVLWYVLSLYLDALEFDSRQIGYIWGVGSAASVITLILSGFLADRFGRRLVLVIGLLGEFVGIGLFLAPKNLFVFMLASAVYNMSGSLVWPSLTALMSNKAAPSRLKYLFGFQNFTNYIGMTLATFSGTFAPGLAESMFDVPLATGYWYVFLAAALVALAPVAYLARVKDVERPRESFFLDFDRPMVRALGVYSLQSAMIGFGAGLVIPWIPLVFTSGMGAGEMELSLMLTVTNMAVTIGYFIVPVFAEAKGSVALVAICQISSVAFLMLVPFAPWLWLGAVLYAIRSFLMLFPTPVLNAYIMNVVTERIRASFIAVSQLAWTVAYSIAAALAGYIWADDYSKVEPFIYCGVMYTVGSIIFWAYFRRVNEPDDAKDPSNA